MLVHHHILNGGAVRKAIQLFSKKKLQLFGYISVSCETSMKLFRLSTSVKSPNKF